MIALLHRKPVASAAIAAAGLITALIAVPAVAQNTIGPPSTPGTRTPEQSPINQTPVAPTLPTPSTIAAPSAAVGPPATATTGDGSASSPGLSFGAAPAPVVSPGR
jgi:hypothetical protein